MEGERRRLEPRHADKLNRQRRNLRLKWTDLAKLAGMSAQNLLRIRTGEITVSEDAAEGIDDAFNWVPGEGIDAILDDREPTERPPRIEVDPLRDETERELWRFVKRVGEDLVWEHIDERRERLAEEARQHQLRNNDTA